MKPVYPANIKSLVKLCAQAAKGDCSILVMEDGSIRIELPNGAELARGSDLEVEAKLRELTNQRVQ